MPEECFECCVFEAFLGEFVFEGFESLEFFEFFDVFDFSSFWIDFEVCNKDADWLAVGGCMVLSIRKVSSNSGSDVQNFFVNQRKSILDTSAVIMLVCCSISFVVV